MRKLLFGVFDLDRHKPSCTATEDGKSLEILDEERRGVVLLKALISFAANHEADLRPCFPICESPGFPEWGLFEFLTKFGYTENLNYWFCHIASFMMNNISSVKLSLILKHAHELYFCGHF